MQESFSINYNDDEDDSLFQVMYVLKTPRSPGHSLSQDVDPYFDLD